MKARIAMIICLSLIILKPTFAQQTDPNVSIDKTLKKYRNMKRGGIALIVTGGILLVVGGAIEVNQVGNSVDPTSPEFGEPYDATGSVLMFTGAAMVGGGIPLAVIGNKKYKKYQNPAVVSLGIKSTQRSTGLGLTFK